MKVSEKQLLMLMDVLKATLGTSDPIGGYDHTTRLQLVNDLMNQQSNDLKEVEPSVKRGKKVLNG